MQAVTPFATPTHADALGQHTVQSVWNGLESDPHGPAQDTLRLHHIRRQRRENFWFRTNGLFVNRTRLCRDSVAFERIDCV